MTNATADSRKICFKTSLFVLSHHECSRAVTRFQFCLLARAAKTPVQGKFPEEIKEIRTNLWSAILLLTLNEYLLGSFKRTVVDVVSRKEVIRGGMREETFPLVSEMTKMRPIVPPPLFSPLLFCFCFFMALFYRTIDKWQEAGWDWEGIASSTLVNLPLKWGIKVSFTTLNHNAG